MQLSVVDCLSLNHFRFFQLFCYTGCVSKILVGIQVKFSISLRVFSPKSFIFQPSVCKIWRTRIGLRRSVVCLEAINSFWSEVISTCLKLVKSVIMLNAQHYIYLGLWRNQHKHKSSQCTLSIFLNDEARCT